MRTLLNEEEQVYSEQHAKELLAIQANYNKKLEQLNIGLAKQKSDLSDLNVPTRPPITRDQVFFAYDKKSFDGIGVNDAFIERDGDPKKAEPLLEGHDFFQSHGAFRLS